MNLADLFDRIEQLASISYDDPASGKRLLAAATEIRKEIESYGQMVIDAVAEMLDHPDPDVNIAAVFCLGQEWAIAHYEKMMELSRRHPDLTPYQRVVLTPVIATFYVTGAPALRDFLDEFADISADHASLLARQVMQFTANVERSKMLRKKQDGQIQ